MTSSAHTALVNDVLLACSRGSTRLFRNPSGLAVYPDGSRVPYGVGPHGGGGADIVGWTVRNGHAVFVALECKTGRAVASAAQKNFVRAVIAAGGVAAVVRSVEQAQAMLRGGLRCRLMT